MWAGNGRVVVLVIVLLMGLGRWMSIKYEELLYIRFIIPGGEGGARVIDDK